MCIILLKLCALYRLLRPMMDDHIFLACCLFVGLLVFSLVCVDCFIDCSGQQVCAVLLHRGHRHFAGGGEEAQREEEVPERNLLGLRHGERAREVLG